MGKRKLEVCCFDATEVSQPFSEACRDGTFYSSGAASLFLPLHFSVRCTTSLQISTNNFNTMSPKGKVADKGGAGKGKGKGKADDKEEKAGKVKGAQQINVRHILVYRPGRG
jgi:hypothetical protein